MSVMLDLDKDNLTLVTATVDEVRAWLDGTLDPMENKEEFSDALDDMQSTVFNGSENEAYVVIKIVKDSAMYEEQKNKR